MVDARMRSEWLHQPQFWELSDHAHRVLVGALQLGNAQGTDGRIGPAYVQMLHPQGVPDQVAAELVGHGHWERTPDGGYQVLDWAGSKGQSTAAEVRGYRARKRANQAAYRARLAAKDAAAVPPQPTASARPRAASGSVTGHVTAGVTGQVGAARRGSGSSSSSVSPPPAQGGGGDTGNSPRVRTRGRSASLSPQHHPAPATGGTPRRLCDRREHAGVELSATGVCPACRGEQVGDDTRNDRESRLNQPKPDGPAGVPRRTVPAPARTPVAAPAPAPVLAPLHLVTDRRVRRRPSTNPPWRQLALRLFVQPAQPVSAPAVQPERRSAAAA
ncbi:hypothetical protein MXD61_06930 [Frankia sp. AgPm24]|uniref:hypothetical protein n=1 Tax=Frankia sp. AgPm24 TaxID=631128 RepID=UPI00200FD2CA|nr:hypothetical protein [Frankia sp. AgPm24]MCK9921625.1 hypothetical protein [Frankia sp. AgPm24]